MEKVEAKKAQVEAKVTEIKATAPIGNGCKINPKTVATNKAIKCQASTETSAGTGENQMIAPTKIVINPLRCFLFIFSHILC